MKKLNHDKLGEITILLEYECGEKKIAFVSSYRHPRWDHHNDKNTWVHPKHQWGKLPKKQYYALWGNDENLDTRGITHLRTPKNCDPRNPNKYFFELLQSSEFITFRK
jgi:hypothetical protein